MDKQKKPYMHIDGFTLEEEVDWLETTARRLPEGSLIVELGSWRGRSTGALLFGCGGKRRLIAVDTWMGQPSMRETDHRDAKVADVFLQFMANMAYLGYVPGWYTRSGNANGFYYLRMDSLDAAQLFDDESVDMVFIDSDHERCEEDCRAWLPKVKFGGIVSGHDYSENFPKVRGAVDKRFPEIRRVGSIWIAPRLYQ